LEISYDTIKVEQDQCQRIHSCVPYLFTVGDQMCSFKTVMLSI